MPSRIRSLPDGVINQIAAGEVVERPASVVKELLENSLDAGATHIEVSFRNGGKSFIEVTDDGFGMNNDDALLAFDRHTTSKIQYSEDLKSVKTLGFRGEALSSIAAVSRLIMATSQKDVSEGVEVSINGGVLHDVKNCPPIAGSKIQIKSLFFNTPARRKFLRSEKIEAARIHEVVARQALGSPCVSFKLIRDGNLVFDLPSESSSGGYNSRVSLLFGSTVAKSLAEVEYNYAGMSLIGLVSKPGYERSGREAQHVFINDRYVRDRLLFYSIDQGYRSLVPKGKHPAVYLRITMDPDKVDVNVSPTKTEVRFADTRPVIELVENGISFGLSKAKGVIIDGGLSMNESDQINDQRSHGAPNNINRPLTVEDSTSVASDLPEAKIKVVDMVGHSGQSILGADSEHIGDLLTRSDWVISEGFRAVGQIFNTFIVIEDGNQVLLLDQHTAHERINYERLVEKYSKGKIESQDLLFPINLDVTKADHERIMDALEHFKALGFSLEDFGGHTIAIRATPSVLGEVDFGSLVIDVLHGACDLNGEPDFSKLAESTINIMACRSSVMAGEKLDQDEINALVEDLKKCSLPYTCPHGRPVAMSITENELLKKFMRK
ncbi:MAG TPA: DNA mismatch repair endonuclease MutL [Nitrospinota bacterium]|nr:DNA mismatch repair endonuclease MutL [Nitrospinota bacterium]|tara:strand:- start:84215 stop:86038 length:1824 start_codon:yes stop_codon:yes gene_type:complete